MNPCRMAFCAILIFVSVAIGQYNNDPWAIGPHLVISFPQSDFANLSKTGEGIGGKLLYRPENMPFINLRADLAYISYGEKRKSETASSGGYFLVTTRNESFQLTAGPQLVFKGNVFIPYCAALLGIYNYSTVVSIPEYYYYYGYPVAETTSSLTRFGWNVNAGVMLDVGLGPLIDLSVKYQKIINAVKTRQGNETITNDADDINISIGVVFFLKKN
jgi:hypothetical protein